MIGRRSEDPTRRQAMTFLRFALLAFALVYVGFLALLFFSQRSMIYPGAAIRVPPEPEPAPGLERWLLETPTGKGEALFLPALPLSSEARPALVFGHGNGEVADFWVRDLDGFRERGIGVLLVEYPGYGRSPGVASERSIRAAVVAAYDRLVADPRVDPSRVIGFGQSLGAGAVCLLSRDRPLRALILQSTFPSLAIFSSRYYAPSALLLDRFDNEAALRAFTGPVLVLHGRADELIPWRAAERLAAAAPHATFRLYDCAHNCWEPERLPFWKDVDAFLSDAGLLRGEAEVKR